MVHSVVKASKLVLTGVGQLQQQLILPNLVRRESLDQFKGSLNDTITFRVPGTLPARDYAFRNDRTSTIVYDDYAETTVNVTLSGNAYSAVKITDEQQDFDLQGSSVLLEAQTRAVSSKLEHAVADAMVGQTYTVNVSVAAIGSLKAALIEARRVLNVYGVQGNRVLVVGSAFESALLSDATLSLAGNVGEADATSQLHEATIGRRYGFTIVVDQTIPAGNAYAFVEDAFILATAVPSIPKGAPFGATVSSDGLSMRLVRDYDTDRMQDRQVVNTWYGARSVVDTIRYWDAAATPKQEKISTAQFFVRGIKLSLTGTSTYPAGASAINVATGIAAP